MCSNTPWVRIPLYPKRIKNNMLLLIILLPLFGFFGGSLFGRFLGKGVCWIATLNTFLCFSISFLLFLKTLANGNIIVINVTPWFYSDTIKIDWCFYFDSLTCIMLVVVTFISTLVHLYSTEYMEFDPHLQRFMAYLSLFTFFMIILVTASNFVQMFVGWEGVGLASYLLINFWFTRIQANKSAIKAMLVNRVGDFFILLGVFTIFIIFNSFDYNIVFSLVPLIKNYNLTLFSLEIPVVDIISLFLFLGAMGKSAQLGLHSWLPDAMEGPTPVSALIHAATMVTAGIFLISRCSYFFEYSPAILHFVTFIGACTAFFAATTGLFQNDIKKVIAYSTCSQLGYMVFACGLSSYDVAMFHLSNHAFFKALLFLGAGSIIHALADEQDMRKMGGLKNVLPLSYAISLIGSLALIGFPFLAGFYSKDVILEVSFTNFQNFGSFSYILGCLSAFCTAFYSTRLFYLVFLAKPNGNKQIILNAHEPSWKMSLPLIILSLMSIFVGFLSKDFFIGPGNDFWGLSLFVLSKNYSLTDIEFAPIQYKLLPLVLTFIGVFGAYALYTYKLSNYLLTKQNCSINNMFTFFNKKWYFDRIYNQIIGQNVLNSGHFFLYQSIDRGLIENFGPYGIVNFVKYSLENIKKYQSGFVLDYFFYFLPVSVLSVCAILFNTKIVLFLAIFYMILSLTLKK